MVTMFKKARFIDLDHILVAIYNKVHLPQLLKFSLLYVSKDEYCLQFRFF
jgi:hypothetical protein